MGLGIFAGRPSMCGHVPDTGALGHKGAWLATVRGVGPCNSVSEAGGLGWASCSPSCHLPPWPPLACCLPWAGPFLGLTRKCMQHWAEVSSSSQICPLHGPFMDPVLCPRGGSGGLSLQVSLAVGGYPASPQDIRGLGGKLAVGARRNHSLRAWRGILQAPCLDRAFSR